MDYEFFMSQAYGLALKAFEAGETPIGCVVVNGGAVTGCGYNQRNTKKNALFHAELAAIYEACEAAGDWRLEDAALFTTIEPCPMCAGAIVQARIKEVVFGAENKKAGCGGSVLNLFDVAGFNHRVNVVKGVMETECAALMSLFFARLREKQIKLDTEIYYR